MPARTEDYRPYGGCWRLLHYQGPEVLISGPAGTGKSLACLYKLHLCCLSIANVRCLMLRKTRESLTEAALVSYEQFVLGDGHPLRDGPRRSHRQSYHYPNGSEIIVAGMDKPGKVMSTEYDLIYVQEAIELTEDAWESATTRLRNGRLSYQQILADTNPDRPTHWLKQRCNAGRTSLVESRHEDNPLLWDARTSQWTETAHKPDGSGYIDKLDALTGARKQRLRYGRWVQSEGVVYEGWDAAIHLIDPFPIPAHWQRYWSVDFGFTHPFVCQFWARDPDGRLYLYREIYHTQRLVEDHARRMVEISRGEPRPIAVICDHDAEDRATLNRHLRIDNRPAGERPALAVKDKSPGIQAVAARLLKARDGKPRLFIMRGALDERDRELVDKKLPCCTPEEFDGYVWRGHTKPNTPDRKEEPVKENDHGMDALRYVVATLDLKGPGGFAAAGQSVEVEAPRPAAAGGFAAG